MKFIVFGANGRVGSKVVSELLDRGHSVRAFVHSGSLPEHEKLEIVKGDATNKEDVYRAVRGVNVVVSCLGSWGTENKNVLSTAMKFIVPAMEEQGIRRIVSLTGNAARLPDETLPIILRLSRNLLKIGQGNILEDGEKHLEILANSSLKWTVVRSGIMHRGGKSSYVLRNEKGSMVIPRQAVVNAIADLSETTEWSGQEPFILRD